MNFIAILGKRRPTDNQLLRFQKQFCNEGFIEDVETVSTASSSMPKEKVSKKTNIITLLFLNNCFKIMNNYITSIQVIYNMSYLFDIL